MPSPMEMYKFEDCGCSFEIIGKPPLSGIDRPAIKFDPDNIPYTCQKTWDFIGSGKTAGVFQLETSYLGGRYSKKLKPEHMQHLAALAAIIRPGTSHSIDETTGLTLTDLFCERKNGNLETTSYHPALDEILKKTYNVLVFQQKVAGFNLQEADTLRKCVTGDTMFISKKRGWISIDDLLVEGYENDLFLVMDENGYQQWKVLEKIWCTGRKDVNKVETQSGFYVKASRYHQFATAKGWKARLRLQDDDRLVVCKEVTYDGQDNSISQEKAFVIAGVVAEGYFSEKGQSTFVNFDTEMMHHFTVNYEKVFGDKPKLSPDKKVAYIHKAQKLELNKYLSYGLSADKFLPKQMMQMTLESTRMFLSFLLGCEGGYTKSTKQFEFSSKSKKLTEQVKLLLLRFGIRSNMLKKPLNDQMYYRLYINDINCQEKLRVQNLLEYWPKYKRDDFIDGLGRKCNYTTDSIPTEIVQKMTNQYPQILGVGQSGRWYKSSISRNVFQEFAHKTNDGYWINLAEGKQVYEPLHSKEEWFKQQKVYDFTVAGGDTPYIIANGMVIHNSIGKKNAQEMAKVKKWFMEKSSALGVITHEQAVEIFGWIQQSQRYSFVLAHAYAYAVTGYVCAYLKTHFPVEFFCSWLRYAKDKAETFDEVATLVNDAKTMGIDIYPPDIRTMEPHFHTDGISINFGLSNVKGVGVAQMKSVNKTMKETETLLGKPIKDWSWYDFIVYASPKLSKCVVEPFILTGCLRHMRIPRQLMLHEYTTFAELSNGEMKWITEHAKEFTNIIDAMKAVKRPKKEGGGCHDKKRLAIVDSLISLLEKPLSSVEDDPNTIAANEEEYLGVAITCSKTDGKESNRANITCKEFLDGRASAHMVFKVQINEAKPHTIKKKGSQNFGKEMGFLKISDSTCALDNVMAHVECWEEFKSVLTPGRIVELQCEKPYKKDGLLVKKVWPL
jgi:DNA polymerase-3 subunit alpha